MTEPPNQSNGIAPDVVQVILAAPATVETLPDGRVRVTKAGVVGVGSTLVEASRDMTNKLAAVHPRSEWPMKDKKSPQPGERADLATLTDAEALALLRTPLKVETLEDGSTRMTKAHLVGIGLTRGEAAEDLASKLAVLYARPLPRGPQQP